MVKRDSDIYEGPELHCIIHEAILLSFAFSSVLRHSLAEMLTGVTWQLGIVILVLIEVLINLVLMLIEFHVIKGNNDINTSKTVLKNVFIYFVMIL